MRQIDASNPGEQRAVGAIRKLKDTDLAFINYMQDIRDLRVVDASGVPVGSVNTLYLDSRQRRIRLFQVTSNWPQEPHRDRFVVPVDAITTIRDGVVMINVRIEDLAPAPDDDELADPDILKSLYALYNLVPYWQPEYVYPRFPHYL